MKVALGLDVATVTGIATLGLLSQGQYRIRSETFQCQGKTSDDKCLRLMFHVKQFLIDCRDNGIEIVAAYVEKPIIITGGGPRMRVKMKGDLFAEEAASKASGANAHTIAQLQQMAGCAIGVLGCYNIRAKFIAENAWRKAILGKSRAPKDIVGSGKRKKWLKDLAMDHARLIKGEPRNDNEGDATCIAEKAMLDNRELFLATPRRDFQPELLG